MPGKKQTPPRHSKHTRITIPVEPPTITVSHASGARSSWLRTGRAGVPPRRTPRWGGGGAYLHCLVARGLVLVPEHASHHAAKKKQHIRGGGGLGRMRKIGENLEREVAKSEPCSPQTTNSVDSHARRRPAQNMVQGTWGGVYS